MEPLWLAYLVDKAMLLVLMTAVAAALAFGWVVPARAVGEERGTSMPLPALDLSDLLLLIGVKEAQMAALQRQLTDLERRVSEGAPRA